MPEAAGESREAAARAEPSTRVQSSGTVQAGEHRRYVLPPATAALTSALLYGLSFPPAGLHVLAWVALVPWLITLRRVTLGVALALTILTTLSAFVLVASWLPLAVTTYYEQPLVLGVGVSLGVWAVTIAPWILGFTVAYRTLARRGGIGVPLTAAAAWVAFEIGRVRLLIGNPFGLLGYSQAQAAALAQIAEVTGVYGVTYLIAAVNVALAELCMAVVWRQRPVRRAFVDLSFVGALVCAAVGYGVVRLHNETIQGAAEATQIAIVQGNVNIGSQWREEFSGRNFEQYVQLTRKALEKSHPTLVVWPENTMTFFLEDAAGHQHTLGQLLGPGGVQLLAGGPRWVAAAAGAMYYNSMFLIGPGGNIMAHYDKEQLLPFAESFPFGSGALVRRRFGGVTQFASGTQIAPLPTVAGPAGIVICNEVMFPEIAAVRVRAGAGFLVNPSNDSWIPSPQFSAQALDMARFRAIEQRRYLVRASTSGPSAIVDPWGRILAQTETATQATTGGTLRAETALTPYARSGDLFGVLCGVATGVALLFPRRGADALDVSTLAAGSARE